MQPLLLKNRMPVFSSNLEIILIVLYSLFIKKHICRVFRWPHSLRPLFSTTKLDHPPSKYYYRSGCALGLPNTFWIFSLVAGAQSPKHFRRELPWFPVNPISPIPPRNEAGPVSNILFIATGELQCCSIKPWSRPGRSICWALCTEDFINHIPFTEIKLQKAFPRPEGNNKPKICGGFFYNIFLSYLFFQLDGLLDL